MLQQAADVPARDVGESAVARLVVEQRLAVVPQGLVGVHAGAVVAEERLRHERRGLAPLVRGVLDDVLELQDVVGRVHHRVEAVVDLRLAARAHLVVRALQDEAGVDELQRDVVAQIGLLVDRAHREVAALVRCLVREVSALLGAARVPGALLGVDRVEARVLLHLVTHVVEDVELGLGGEVGGVGDAGGGEVLLGLLGDLTRVLRVDLAVAGVVDVEDHDERPLGAERVHICRRDVGDELHVRLVDRGEAANRRAVEELADGEELLVDRRRGDVEVLLHTGQIGEADIKELDVSVLDELEHLGRITEHAGTPNGIEVVDCTCSPRHRLGGGSFPAVTQMFQGCYEYPGPVNSVGCPRTPLPPALETSRPAGTRVSVSVCPRRAADRWGAPAAGSAHWSSTGVWRR